MKPVERKALEERIKERKRFVQEVYNFATDLLKEYRVTTLTKETDNYTHQISEVDFGDFIFVDDNQQNMVGRSNLKVYYHGRENTDKVLDLEHFGHFNIFDEDSRVRFYRENHGWSERLHVQMSRKDEILAERARTIEQEKTRQRVRHSNAEKDRLVTEEAQRWGFGL